MRQPSKNLFAKVTLQPGLNNRVEASYNYARGTPQDPGFRIPYFMYALSSNGQRYPGTIHAARVTWTRAASAKELGNELVAGYLQVRESCEPESSFPEVAARVEESVLHAGVTSFCLGNFSNQDIWELTDNLSWTRGRHQITFGTHLEFIRTERTTSPQPLGRWDFADLDGLEAGTPESYSRSFSQRPDGDGSELGINQVGFYVQDQWAPVPGLTLTAGLRADVPYVTSRPVGNPLLASELGIDNTTVPSGNVQWSPRIGASYDLGRAGFLRGGIGLFAGRPAYHWLISVYGFNGLEGLALFCDGSDVPAFTLDPANQPTTCGGGASGTVTEVNYFNAGFRFPRNFRVSLGADLRLPGGLLGTVDLMFIRGVDQYYAADMNLENPVGSSGEGGRLLYGSLDPATGSATTNRRSGEFGPVIEIRNASGDRTWMGSVQLQKRLRSGVDVSLAYTYTDSKDRMSAAHDLASFNTASFNVLDGSLADRRLATSLYSVPHKVTFVGAVDLPLRFRFALAYNGQSGSPYTFRVLGDANADGVTAFGGPSSNDPIYVPRSKSDITLAEPEQWEALDGFIEEQDCLRTQRGQLQRRNSCRNPWMNIVNARFSTVLPTFQGHSIELMADVFNVLNLIDGDWGIRRGAEATTLLRLRGYDQANGRGIYQFTPRDLEARDVEGSRWRLQLGARYTF